MPYEAGSRALQRRVRVPAARRVPAQRRPPARRPAKAQRPQRPPDIVKPKPSPLALLWAHTFGRGAERRRVVVELSEDFELVAARRASYAGSLEEVPNLVLDGALKRCRPQG